MAPVKIVLKVLDIASMKVNLCNVAGLGPVSIASKLNNCPTHCIADLLANPIKSAFSLTTKHIKTIEKGRM